MPRYAVTLLAACLGSTSAVAVDVNALWDFGNPQLSESRFRAALQSARGDDALILQAQIARTYVLRGDFDQARTVLRSIKSAIKRAGAEAQVRYWLELGRTYSSHRHTAESQTPEVRGRARAANTRALEIAKRSKLDALAIDAIHMFAFIDTAPADQLKRGLEALALIESSSQPDAKKWEASIRGNLGEALYELERYDEARLHFEAALALWQQRSNRNGARDAQWHIARVLRVQRQTDAALAIQLRLEKESDAAGDPKRYIFEELELLHRDKGSTERASHYAERARSLSR
jgi:tetratricopeptide (TPR) repeat protein